MERETVSVVTGEDDHGYFVAKVFRSAEAAKEWIASQSNCLWCKPINFSVEERYIEEATSAESKVS